MGRWAGPGRLRTGDPGAAQTGPDGGAFGAQRPALAHGIRCCSPHHTHTTHLYDEQVEHAERVLLKVERRRNVLQERPVHGLVAQDLTLGGALELRARQRLGWGGLGWAGQEWGWAGRVWAGAYCVLRACAWQRAECSAAGTRMQRAAPSALPPYV